MKFSSTCFLTFLLIIALVFLIRWYLIRQNQNIEGYSPRSLSTYYRDENERARGNLKENVCKLCEDAKKNNKSHKNVCMLCENEKTKRTGNVKDVCELCDGVCLGDHDIIGKEKDVVNLEDCRKMRHLKYVNIQSKSDDNYLEFSGINFRTFTKPRSNYRNVGNFEYSKDPQKWSLVPITGCYFYIRSKPVTKDIPEYYLMAAKNGNVGVSLFGKSTNQKWNLVYNEGDDSYYIKNAKYNTYLTSGVNRNVDINLINTEENQERDVTEIEPGMLSESGGKKSVYMSTHKNTNGKWRLEKYWDTVAMEKEQQQTEQSGMRQIGLNNRQMFWDGYWTFNSTTMENKRVLHVDMKNNIMYLTSIEENVPGSDSESNTDKWIITDYTHDRIIGGNNRNMIYVTRGSVPNSAKITITTKSGNKGANVVTTSLCDRSVSGHNLDAICYKINFRDVQNTVKVLKNVLDRYDVDLKKTAGLPNINLEKYVNRDKLFKKRKNMIPTNDPVYPGDYVVSDDGKTFAILEHDGTFGIYNSKIIKGNGYFYNEIDNSIKVKTMEPMKSRTGLIKQFTIHDVDYTAPDIKYIMDNLGAGEGIMALLEPEGDFCLYKYMNNGHKNREKIGCLLTLSDKSGSRPETEAIYAKLENGKEGYFSVFEYTDYIPYETANRTTIPGKLNVIQYRGLKESDFTDGSVYSGTDSKSKIYNKTEARDHGQCKARCSQTSDCNWFQFYPPNSCYLGANKSILGGKYDTEKEKAIW